MPSMRLDGDASGAIKATAEFNREVKNIKSNFDASAASAKQLEKAAGQIIRANEAPLDTYNRKLKELAKLVTDGKLSHEQAGVAAKRYHADLQREQGKTLSGYALELRAQQNSREMLARMSREVHSVGQAQSVAFGEAAAANVAGYFSMFVGPAALASGAISAIQEYRAELSKLGQELQGDRAGLGQLTQLAMTSDNPAAKMQQLMQQSREAFASGAALTLPAGGKLAFALDSAGITAPKDRKLALDLTSWGIIQNTEDFASGVAAIKDGFPKLSPGKILGMGIAAAVPSPGSAEGIATEAAKSAQQLKVLGWSPGYGLAQESILSRAFKGPQEGGTRAEQYMKQLEHHGFAYDPGIKGLDPFQTLERIGAKTKGGTDRPVLEKYLGDRAEAIGGFRTLYDRRAELKNWTRVSEGSGEELVAGALDLARDTPEIDVARTAIAARNQRSLSRSRAQQTSDLYQAAVDESVSGKGALETWAIKLAGAFQGLSESMQEGSLRGWLAEGAGSQEWRDSVARYLQSIDRKARDVVPSGVQER